MMIKEDLEGDLLTVEAKELKTKPAAKTQNLPF